jgi:hypothetical protein
MNLHAEKVRCTEDSASRDEELGGVIEEIHQCPACGEILARPVS